MLYLAHKAVKITMALNQFCKNVYIDHVQQTRTTKFSLDSDCDKNITLIFIRISLTQTPTASCETSGNSADGSPIDITKNRNKARKQNFLSLINYTINDIAVYHQSLIHQK